MATTKPKAEAETKSGPALDRKGYITVKNGDQVAKILPESWKVWEKRGWEAVDPDGVSPVEADPFTNDETDTVDDAQSAAPLKLEG